MKKKVIDLQASDGGVEERSHLANYHGFIHAAYNRMSDVAVAAVHVQYHEEAECDHGHRWL